MGQKRTSYSSLTPRRRILRVSEEEVSALLSLHGIDEVREEKLEKGLRLFSGARLYKVREERTFLLFSYLPQFRDLIDLHFFGREELPKRIGEFERSEEFEKYQRYRESLTETQ